LEKSGFDEREREHKSCVLEVGAVPYFLVMRSRTKIKGRKNGLKSEE
jgi:hypothetical protein